MEKDAALEGVPSAEILQESSLIPGEPWENVMNKIE
jgi:hypothetical protein